MADYGFRISKDGVDVKTGNDIDMVVTSKYLNLKGVLSGTTTAQKTDDYQSKSLITHNLGYQPIVQVYLYIGSNKWLPLPHPVPFTCNHYTNTTTVYVYFGTGMSNATYTFKYFIFIDKGKI